MNFNRENVEALVCDDGLVDLVLEHHQSTSHDKDLHLNLNFDAYRSFENQGVLRVFTARDNAGALVGYCLMLVGFSLHFNRQEAHQETLFTDPERRGFWGYSFLKYVDEQLQAEGIAVVYQHVTARLDFSRLLERLGYELSERVYVRTL